MSLTAASRGATYEVSLASIDRCSLPADPRVGGPDRSGATGARPPGKLMGVASVPAEGEIVTGFRNFLTRFRPAVPPGRAVPGGVPTDRSAELRAELAPPLLLLEQAEAEARSVRGRAAEDAASRLEEAERRAEEIVAEACEQADQVRAHTARRVLRAAEEEAALLLAAAEREAAAVRDRARSRVPVLADRVVALVLEDLATEEASHPPLDRHGPPQGNGP